MSVELRADLAPATAISRALELIGARGPWTEETVEAVDLLKRCLRQIEFVERIQDDARKREALANQQVNELLGTLLMGIVAAGGEIRVRPEHMQANPPWAYRFVREEDKRDGSIVLKAVKA